MEERSGIGIDAAPGDLVNAGDYNFAHFRARHFLNDLAATVQSRGVQPGTIAPDWELPLTNGGTIRLSELRGRPVLLHFGSST